MRLVPLGERALIAYDVGGDLGAYARQLNEARVPGLLEVVASYDTLGLYIEPNLFDPSQLPQPTLANQAEKKLHLIPVCYEMGEDLGEVAAFLEMTPEKVIEAHISLRYTCYAIGFCPGFPYLGYLPAAISEVPRRKSPRVRVEPGSVGITGRQTGIYPLERPGGWPLIGKTPLTLVDIQEEYFPIEAGDEVEFSRINAAEFERLKGDAPLSKKVDLNVDIGEGFPHDEALMQFATSVNICCGEHAGSWELTEETVRLSREKGMRIGAHPGFPDRTTMGRRPLTLKDIELLRESIKAQMERFRTLEPPAYVKPHGAWYNAICSNRATPEIAAVSTAAALIAYEVCLPGRTPLMLLGGSLEEVSSPHPDLIISEGFADRAYSADRTLKPRSESGAVLEDPQQIRAQVIELASAVESICIHGDTSNCLEFAEMVYQTLKNSGFEVGY